jgi:RimJ/RimL family protein N-acetyltransferase
LLRGYRNDDADALYELTRDPDVTRYVGDGSVPTREECWRAVALWIGHWALRGHGLWAVEERASGRFIGRIGIWNPEGWPGPELGYLLGRAWWGRGYATEAGRVAMDWAFERLPIDELMSLIHPDNGASIAVATRLGERPVGESELRGRRLLRYIITRPEWEQRGS